MENIMTYKNWESLFLNCKNGTVTVLRWVLFSCSVVSNSLWLHGLQHARLPCPSPPSGACSNSRPSSWWSHPTISSSVVVFSCLKSFSASGSFPELTLHIRGPENWSFSFSISLSPMNNQGWFPLGWTGLISLLSMGPSWVFPSTMVLISSSFWRLQG